MRGIVRLTAMCILVGASGATAQSGDVPIVQPNDNRISAGALKDGVLTVKLVVMSARWYPDAADGESRVMPVFAEEGGPPQIPAPLIRVPEGTLIEATVRNALPDSTLRLYWLATKPQAGRDSVLVPPGESAVLRFPAGAPGTYMYGATAGFHDPEIREREQLIGAFVIDEAGARADDRVFVINIWGEPEDSATYAEALAINGKSWPHTERIAATVGDTLPWRVINGSARNHPMHLHGFYYTVDARGNPSQDTAYAPDRRKLVVTEDMNAFSTMRMSWVPERPGNWLFHCHLAFHVVGEARLGGTDHQAHSDDPMQHMAGLVMGIAVRRPDAGWKDEPRGNPRRINLFVNEGKPLGRGDAARGMAFVQQRDGHAPAADSVEIPGSLLVVTRGEPTDIAVINRLAEPTSVHWHGIELESFSDGVAGWSGIEHTVAPVVAPGDTFVARLSLPRTGTFIYHTHLNDIEQVTAGLYGALLVLAPGQTFDPASDHVFVTGWDGFGKQGKIVVNGDTVGAPITLDSRVDHRFRFVNIGPAQRLVYELLRDTVVAQWRPFAKDGADLPASQTAPEGASKRLGVGETFDAVARLEPGEYTLHARLPAGNRRVLWSQVLLVE